MAFSSLPPLLIQTLCVACARNPACGFRYQTVYLYQTDFRCCSYQSDSCVVCTRQTACCLYQAVVQLSRRQHKTGVFGAGVTICLVVQATSSAILRLIYQCWSTLRGTMTLLACGLPAAHDFFSAFCARGSSPAIPGQPISCPCCHWVM